MGSDPDETPYERMQERRRGEIEGSTRGEPEWQRVAREARKQRREELAKAFPPPGRRRHCWDCSKEMEPYSQWKPGTPLQYGYEGNNHFCTLRCGFRWALAQIP